MVPILLQESNKSFNKSNLVYITMQIFVQIAEMGSESFKIDT